MNFHKRIKKNNINNIYVNIVLLVLFCMVGICLFNSCKKSDSSWETIKATNSGTIMLAYVQNSNGIYEDKNGQLYGEGVEILSQFKKHVENLHSIKILTQLEKFNNAQEVLRRIRYSNGGVFGWDIDYTIENEIYKISLPYGLADTKDGGRSNHTLALKENSDWIPVLTSFIESIDSNKPGLFIRNRDEK